jgi:hypothetical protein
MRLKTICEVMSHHVRLPIRGRLGILSLHTLYDDIQVAVTVMVPTAVNHAVGTSELQGCDSVLAPLDDSRR